MTTHTLARTNGHPDTDQAALAIVAPSPGLAPLYDVPAAMTQMAALRALVDTYLRPSTTGKTDGDYGIIPGTDKPTLLKSGADKLCDVYGLLPLYEELGVVEDWEHGLFAYRLRCRIVLKSTGAQVGEGVGACNSRETKYQSTAWWNDKTTDPPAGQGWTEIQTRKGKAWKRKVAADNPADQINTILKMAKKRALVDAVLSVTRSSGLFTQDMEDFVPPALTPASPDQLDRLARGFAKLAADGPQILTVLGAVLTQDAANLALSELRRLYKATATEGDASPEPAPTTPSGEPVHPVTGEIADAPAADADVGVTPIRQVVVSGADAAAWTALGRNIEPTQKDEIGTLVDCLGWNRATSRRYLQEHYRVDTRDALTGQQAAEMIADLQGKLAESEPAT